MGASHFSKESADFLHGLNQLRIVPLRRSGRLKGLTRQAVPFAVVFMIAACSPQPTEPERKPAEAGPPTVQVGKGPDALLLSLDATKAFVANVEDTTLSVVDLEKLEVTATVEVGQSPWGLAHLGRGDEFVVTVWGASKLVTVDGATYEVKSNVSVQYQPTGIAASPDGSKAYVAGGDHRLHGIDLVSGAEFAAISVGKDSDGVALTADGSAVWVTNTSGSVSVVELREEWSETRIETGGKPEQIVSHPERPLMFVSNFTDNKVLIYETGTLELVRTLDGSELGFKGPEEIRFSPDWTRFFLAGFDSSNVSCFEVNSFEPCGQWPVGSGAIAVEITPDGATAVTTNYRDNTVSVASLAGI